MTRPIFKPVWIPSAVELEQLHRTGQLPLDLAAALTLPEAAGVVLQLPPVRGADELLPEGYGVMPPRRAEPVVRVKKRIVEAYNRVVPPNAKGQLGAMWRRGDRVVFRLWFRADDHVSSAPSPNMRGPVDVYEDAIAAVMGLERKVPSLTGWQIVRLDADNPVR